MLSINQLYQKIFARPDLKSLLFSQANFSFNPIANKFTAFLFEESEIKKNSHFNKLRY